ncbi:hypothetical protein HpBT260_04210 [Helicobacter pylori]
MQTIHIGVLSASDRASKGIYEDLSGKAIQEVLSEYLLNPLEFHFKRYNPRSHRESVPKNASWLWRAYADD